MPNTLRFQRISAMQHELDAAAGMAGPRAMTVVAVGAAAFATIRAVDVSSAVNVGIGLCSVVAVAYISLSNKFHERRRSRRRQEIQDQITEAKKLEAANKDSLTRQIEMMRAQHEVNGAKLRAEIAETTKRSDAAAAESADNQRKMRDTLHDIADQLQQKTLENAELRHDYKDISAQLSEANRQIHDMNDQLARANLRVGELTVQLERLTRAENRKASAIENATARTGLTPDPDAPPRPLPPPGT